MEEKKERRGGARPGSGRPKGDSKLYAFRCPGPLAEQIDAQPNKTGFILKSIAAALERKEEGLGRLGEILPATRVVPRSLPLVEQRVVAGFPVSIGTDDSAEDVDILAMLAPHPETSYMIRVQGDSMVDADIHSGDLVVVDSSRRNPSAKEVAVCELNGEYTLKRVAHEEGRTWLVPANPDFPRFPVAPDDEFSIRGTVTYIIHKAR